MANLQSAPFRRGTNRAAALSARWTRARLSQRDKLYQQVRDAPHFKGRIQKLLEKVADAALRRPRAVQAWHEPQRPRSARCTRAGLSQRDNLYQQHRDARPAWRVREISLQSLGICAMLWRNSTIKTIHSIPL